MQTVLFPISLSFFATQFLIFLKKIISLSFIRFAKSKCFWNSYIRQIILRSRLGFRKHMEILRKQSTLTQKLSKGCYNIWILSFYLFLSLSFRLSPLSCPSFSSLFLPPYSSISLFIPLSLFLYYYRIFLSLHCLHFPYYFGLAPHMDMFHCFFEFSLPWLLLYSEYIFNLFCSYL